MPDTLALKEIGALTVTVSRDELEALVGPTAGSAQAMVDYRQKLVVQAVARQNVRVVGDARVELDPANLVPKATLVFDIEGTNVGPGELWILLRQGPQALSTITLKPTIVESKTGMSHTVRGAARTDIPEPETGLYPLLQIIEVNRGNEHRYQFLLTMDDGAAYQAESEAFKVDQQAYVSAIYKKIEERWLGSERDVAEFGRQLREYGGQLFDELIPPDLQAPLWEVRDRIKAIKVYSTEPFVPWELVHLKEPRALGKPASRLPPEPMFLAQKGLVRWLHGVRAPTRNQTITAGRAFYVVPDYPHPDWKLPGARDEIAFLKNELKARPLDATPEALRAIVTSGDFDLLHFSGHGAADLSGEAKIMLTGRVEGSQYVPEYLDVATVDQSADLGVRRPIVILNACQIGRAGWRLTSIGGFAAAFLRAGAGAFVGTLWSVGDQPARSFTEAFYRALLAKKTLAEATAEGREAASDAGEATWLAYVVYGSPGAQLTSGA